MISVMRSGRLEPFLPRHPRQGHRWNDHRLVIDGIFFRTRTGCPWRDLPERFGNWKTVYNRHRRWSGDGIWEMILGRLRAGCDEAGGRAWTVAADATVGGRDARFGVSVVFRLHDHDAMTVPGPLVQAPWSLPWLCPPSVAARPGRAGHPSTQAGSAHG